MIPSQSEATRTPRQPKGRRSTQNRERGQEKVDEFSEGARQVEQTGERLTMAGWLKGFDEISAGDRKRGKIEK